MQYPNSCIIQKGVDSLKMGVAGKQAHRSWLNPNWTHSGWLNAAQTHRQEKNPAWLWGRHPISWNSTYSLHIFFLSRTVLWWYIFQNITSQPVSEAFYSSKASRVLGHTFWKAGRLSTWSLETCNRQDGTKIDERQAVSETLVLPCLQRNAKEVTTK